MRKLKFRAWIDDSTLCNDIEIERHLDKDGNFIPFMAIINDWYMDDGQMLESFLSGFGEKQIMQYTGLDDMDGREVYENDLVRDGRGGLFQMKQGEYTKTVMIELLKRVHLSSYGWYLQNIESGDIVAATECQYVEKVGNIYENPELLEEVQHDREVKRD